MDFLPLYRYFEKLYPASVEIIVAKMLETIETKREFFRKTRNLELVITFLKFSRVGLVKKFILKISPGFLNAVLISHSCGKNTNIPIVIRKNQKNI